MKDMIVMDMNMKSWMEEQDPSLLTELGLEYRDGSNDIEQNYEKAARLFSVAARQGYMDAQHELAFLYKFGQGVQKDVNLAVNLFQLAAEQGAGYSQCALGEIYFFGHDILQDYHRAAKWCRLAAKQMNSHACLMLGFMHKDGKGVLQDYYSAHMFFNLAASGGDSMGESARDEIAEKMTPKQISEAQDMAREWMTKYC